MLILEESDIIHNFVPPDTRTLKRCFFDFEGSLSYFGDILQLAYMVTDWDFNIISTYNKYFRNHKPIAEEEFSKHKLTPEFLWRHSDHHFSLELPNIPVFKEKNIMFISFTTTDTRRITEQCDVYNLPLVDFGHSATSLKTIPKPVNNYDAFQIKGRSLARSTTKEQKDETVTVTKAEAHNAVYDTYLLYTLCRDYYKSIP